MSKIHISLVGGQPTPIYQGILYTQPDFIHLICSKNSLEQAGVIRKELPIFSDKQVQITEISDSKVEDFERQLSEIVSRLNPEDSVSINLSGGLKAWSIILYKLANHMFPQAFCFCLSQNGRVFSFDRPEVEGIVPFDMEAQFKLLGNPLIHYFPFSEYTEEDDKVYQNVKSAYFKTMKFKGLTEGYLNTYGESFKKSHKYVSAQGCIEWDAETHTCQIQLENNKLFIFSSPNAERLVFKADWFEYEVAKCIAQIYGKENVFMNCRFRSQKNEDKNEVDIIVNTGAKLVFVECKTNISKITDIDKFAAVVKNYGGLGSKAIFITMREMPETQKEKCRDNGINSAYLYNKNDTCLHVVRNKELKHKLDSLVNSWNIK